jgi:long-subunit fatty acid transport protein
MVSTRTKVVRIVFPLTAVALMPAVAGAAGFEKALIWSAKNAGMGGAVTGFVSGAEATVWNPAGLAGSGNEVSGSFGPAFSTFKAPVSSATVATSAAGFSPLFGVAGSYKVNDKLGVGVAVHSIGGSSVKFEGVSFVGASGTGFTSDVSTKLSLVEATLGAGYEVIDGLKIGAGYRVTMASGELVSVKNAGSSNVFSRSELTGLSKTDFGGFRAGIQFAPKGAGWGVGAVYRNSLSPSLAGTGAVSTKSSGTEVPDGVGGAVTFTGGSATVTAKLPQQINVGGFYDFSSSLKVSLDYSLTMYSEMDKLAISLTKPNGTVLPSAATDLTLNWKDQSQVRVGGQYLLNETYTVRGGYVYTSQVTASDKASPTFIPPGVGHSFVVGGSMKITSNLGLDLAGEYAQTKGTSTGNVTAISSAIGEQTATAFTAYAGVTYGF